MKRLYSVQEKIVAVFIVMGALFAAACALLYVSHEKHYPSFLSRKEPLVISTDKVKRVVLPNGMTVLVLEDHQVPQVLVQIAYDIGSAVETAGERGLAHLLEHMIFKGTDKLSEGDIDSIARKYGAEFNAFTSQDCTSYYFRVNSANWKPFIGILADCMVNSRFASEHLASELKAVIAELKMYKDNYWSVMMQTAAALAFPSNYPYHYPIIGFKEDLLNISAEKLKNFYKKYYNPSHATLFVIGDISANEVIAEVEKEFKAIPAAKEEHVPPFTPLFNDIIAHKTQIYRDVDQALLGFYWVVPGTKSKNETTIKALEFLLGGGEGSRLYRRLVEEEKVASSVNAGCWELMETGIFLIFVKPKVGAELRCRTLIDEEISKFISGGVSDQELSKVISNEQRMLLESFEDYQELAYNWIKSYFATRDELALFKQVNEYQKLTSRQLCDFAHKYLDPFVMSEIAILPVPADRKKVLLENEAHQDVLDKEILTKFNRTAPLEEASFVKKLPDATPLSFSFPKPTKEFRLDNGLQVLFHSKKDLPHLTARLQFRDAQFFAQAKEGISLSIVMNMLIEESKNFSKHDHVEFFETHGVRYDFGSAGAELSFLSPDIAAVLERFALIMTTPTFAAGALKKICDITIDSYERAKKSPHTLAMRLLNNSIYRNHPYNWTFSYAIETLKALSSSSVEKLYKERVAPSQMILSVVGDFDSNATQKLITQFFGSWQGKNLPVVEKYEVELSKPEFIDHFMLRNQAVLALGRISPLTIYDADLIPLKMLNFICWYSLGSRLFALREATGLFYTANGAWAANATRQQGYDFLSAVLSVDHLDQAEKGIRDVVEDVAAHGVREDEVEVARQLYIKALIDARSNNHILAQTLSNLAALDLGFDYYDKVLKRVNTMTVKDLNEIAKKYFSTADMNRIRVGRVGRVGSETSNSGE